MTEPIPITLRQLQELQRSLPDPSVEHYARAVLKKPPTSATWTAKADDPAEYPAWDLHFERDYTLDGWSWRIKNATFTITL